MELQLNGERSTLIGDLGREDGSFLLVLLSFVFFECVFEELLFLVLVVDDFVGVLGSLEREGFVLEEGTVGAGEQQMGVAIFLVRFLLMFFVVVGEDFLEGTLECGVVIVSLVGLKGVV